MLAEIDNLVSHKTYGPWRKRAPGEHVIGFTWGVFKTKPVEAVPATASAPAIKAGERDKGRLCVLGYQQIKDKEYSTCSSPTIKPESIKCMYVKAARIPEAVLMKGDCHSAYLKGHTHHKITTGMVPCLTYKEIGAPSPSQCGTSTETSTD